MSEARGDRPRTLDEEDRGIVVGQRLDRVPVLRVDVQRLAARDEDHGVRRPCEEGRDRRGGLDDLLEVVDEDEQPLVRHVLEQPVVGAHRGSDRPLDESRIAESLQRNPEDPVGEVLDRFGRELEREPRLAATAGPREREQAMLADELTGLRELPLPPDERIRLDREVRPIERLQRREVTVAEPGRGVGARSGP